MPTVQSVATTIQTNVAGTTAAQFRERGNEYPVVVRLREADREEIADVGDVLLSTPTGQVVPARNILAVSREAGPTQIQRKNMERITRVNAEIEIPLSDAVKAVQARLPEINVPPDFRVGFGSEIEEQARSFAQLRTILILAAVIVGVWSMLFYSAFIRGLAGQMVRQNISNLTGDLQVQAPGYFENPVLENLLRSPAPARAALRETLPVGSRVTERLRIGGVLRSPHGAFGTTVVGIQPAEEVGISFIVDAIAEGEYALKLVPIDKDSYIGPYLQHQLVRINIQVGEPDKAIDLLEPLLKMPYLLSPDWLRIDPNFDPLRNNPRFRKLVEATPQSP